MNDLISRQAAIDVLDVGKELLSCALDNMDIVGNDREKFEWGLGLIESYIEDIKDIPSAWPERKKGQWIGIDDEPYETWECDQCGYVYEEMPSWTPNFCPYCGADMRGE